MNRLRAPASLLSALVWLVACAAGAPVTAAERAAQEPGPYRFAVARMLAQDGRFAEALATYEQLIDLVPDDPYIRAEMAGLLLRLGKAEPAAEQARAAAELAPGNPDILRLRGQVQLALAEDDPSALAIARQVFEQLRALDPTDLQAMVTLGEIYLSEGRAHEAVEVFREARFHRPESQAVYSFLVDALLRDGQQAEAEKALAEILSLHPDYLKGRTTLAELQSERGDHAAAAATLAAAAPRDLEDPELRRQFALTLYQAGKAEEALEALEPLIAAAAQEPATRYLRAVILSAVGRFAEAERDLRELAERQPDDLEVNLHLARVLEDSGRPADGAWRLRELAARLQAGGEAEEAMRAREEAAVILARAGRWDDVLAITSPAVAAPAAAGDGLGLLLLHVEVLTRLERAQEALEALAAWQEARPELSADPRVGAGEAEVLFALGQEDAAEERLARLAAVDDPEALLAVAEVYQQTERYAQAIPLLERALDSQGDSPRLLFSLGASYERSGRRPDAERTFRRLLAANPDHAPTLNYLGYMWAENGENLEEAVALVNRAVALEPDNGAYVDSLGWAYYQLGRYDEARGHLERAAALVPGDAVVCEHLGDVYHVLGRREQAAEWYRKAVDLRGENRGQVLEKLRGLGGGR